MAAARAIMKKKEIIDVDHSKIEYEPFRKDFYVESPEVARMTEKEIEVYRTELDSIKIRGQRCPKPIRKWAQCGLPLQCEHVIKQLNFERPTPIQAQAIPAIMSGRDVIGVAKTGSGKTMAFLLPMFRHIKDQRAVENMEGPIGIIMTPTRELAIQIHSECKRFTKLMGLRVVCAYGGAPIKDHIADMKRGAEIVVCTPGRLIDLLTANSGRVTNLRRVSYVVLDEADRMFDLGFEQQVMRIVTNVRPDAQRVLFSATFPKAALARRILKQPLEITVGGRSVVCSEVKQIVEVRDEESRFLRLLEILGNWYDDDADQRMLVFVDRQESADNLLRELYRRGYRCVSLHGGKDQMDRDSTIEDFKTGVCSIMIATSVAARGLDVKELNVVVNFDPPNHMEDYVHRCGRTGRAGRRGVAYTFITPEQDKYAPDLYRALVQSRVKVPPELKQLSDEFLEKVRMGEAIKPSSGFSGKGLERIEKDREQVKKAQKKTYGGEELESDDEDEVEFDEDGEPKAKANKQSKSQVETPVQALAKPPPGLNPEARAAFKAAQAIAVKFNASIGVTECLDIAAQITKQLALAAGAETAAAFSAEFEINDFHQKARYKLTAKETMNQIAEISHASVTTRGTYYPPGKAPKTGDRKLYLVIEGESQLSVDKAMLEIRRVLKEANDATMDMSSLGGGGTQARYTVV